jgi:hypothetical protein
MALINLADFQTRLQRTLTEDEGNIFTLLNGAIQTEIEKIIGSSVEEETEDSTRYYDGGAQHLVIDPCTSISSVKLYDDDQVATYTYDTTDYTKEPINTTLKTMIRYREGKFMTGINNIGVTARFSIYADEKTLKVVKDTILNCLMSEFNNTDNIKRESIEGYSIEYFTNETKDNLERIKYLFPQII